MDIYSDYSEFLSDLTQWGSQTLEQGPKTAPAKALRAFLQKAEIGRASCRERV